MLKKTFLFLLVLIILASCSTSRTINNGSFQKRKYNKGVYFNSKSKIQKNNGKEIISASSNFDDGASAKKEVNNSNQDKKKNWSSLNKVKDSITQALLGEINNFGKKPDLPLTASNHKMGDYNAPLLTKNKSYLTINTKDNYVKPNMDESDLPLHRSSKTGAVLFWIGIATLPILGIGALLLIAGYFFSEHGLYKTKQNPELYNVNRAEWWTKAYRTLWVIMVVISTVVVVLVFVFLIWLLSGWDGVS